MSQVFSFFHLTEAITALSFSVRKQDFLTYFKKFSLLSTTDESITLGVVSGFHRDNLIKKFHNEIHDAITNISPSITTVDIIVDDTIESRS
jgi:chromosomal replication initiation ATPase DnaA